MDNLSIYNKVREVPQEAQKTIQGGRLKGMTDINPMWRIKKLTEVFGPCGKGWKPEIKEHWTENTLDSEEITANVKINLFVKYDGIDGPWSDPIEGIGGAMLSVKEKNNKLYVNDECFKMAYTDAISVACKMLGMGADVYWSKDTTKYNDPKKENVEVQNDVQGQMDRLEEQRISITHAEAIRLKAAELNIPLDVVRNEYKVAHIEDLTEAQYGDCMNKFVYESNKRK